MCGIAGKYNLYGGSVSPGLVEKMCDVIKHRGPDDAGVYVDGSIGLGHRRLSILDLSELGHQPMSSKDGKVWIVYNGEIYNFPALRKDLEGRGYTFLSDCDTEVLLSLYQEFGTGCLQHLRGMFAFAIWDEAKKTLFLARDRIGKKPLYYFFDGKIFLFASEIKSILQDADIKKQINFEAFSDYFKYLYVPDPKTIYSGINKLMPGHYLLCNPEGISTREYWDVSFANQVADHESVVAENLIGLLADSVRMRRVSDVPLGAFLSGGIDSSLVVALMARQSNTPVTTCSIGFDSKKYDEVEFARLVAEKYHTDHHELSVNQNAEQVLKKLVYHFDEPFADASSVPTYYVSKLARQKVVVALSGDGGDENFAGYEKYHLDDIENNLRKRIPLVIRRQFFPFLAGMLAKGNKSLFRKGYTLIHSLGFEADYGYYLTNSEFDDRIWRLLLNDDTKKQIGDYDSFSVTEHYYQKADTDCHLSKILYTDLKTYLPGDILVKVDRMSMANSLEVRAPVLDHKVIEYAASIPAELKFRHGEKKYILKRSCQGILPDEILYRKKMGFSVPLADWLRGELRKMAGDFLFGKSAGVNHFFNMKILRSIWGEHQSGQRNYATILWSILMFELWYQEFME